MTYNPLDHILTIRAPQQVARDVPMVPRRKLRAKILMLVLSASDFLDQFGPDWKDTTKPGKVITVTRTFLSRQHAETVAKRFGQDNLVIFCHRNLQVQPFVIAVGITKGCTIQNKSMRGTWQVLAQGVDWTRPLESPSFHWPEDEIDETRAALRKRLCKSQYFTPIPKFWPTFESLVRSKRDMNTNTDAKRLTIFAELAFQLSPESQRAFAKASQQ